MTITPSPIRGRIRRRRRGPVLVRWLVRIAVAAVLFGLGIAVGQALQDRPRTRPPVTNVSTIRPWTQTQMP